MRNLSSSNRWEWERGARRFHVSSSSHFLFLLQSSSLPAWQATGSSEVGCCSGFCFFFAKEVGAVMLLHTRDFPKNNTTYLLPEKKETRTFAYKKSCKSWVALTRRTYSCFFICMSGSWCLTAYYPQTVIRQFNVIFYNCLRSGETAVYH